MLSVARNLARVMYNREMQFVVNRPDPSVESSKLVHQLTKLVALSRMSSHFSGEPELVVLCGSALYRELMSDVEIRMALAGYWGDVTFYRDDHLKPNQGVIYRELDSVNLTLDEFADELINFTFSYLDPSSC